MLILCLPVEKQLLPVLEPSTRAKCSGWIRALVLIICLPAFPAHPAAWAFMSVTAEIAHNPRPYQPNAQDTEGLIIGPLAIITRLSARFPCTRGSGAFKAPLPDEP
jgi:hypothetical protein